MNLDTIHKVYFLGVGGIGMSALARWFAVNGKQVFGYDKTSTPLTKKLEEEGIVINYTDELEFIPDVIKNGGDDLLIVLTPAIPQDSVQLSFFTNGDFVLKKRSEILGLISKAHYTIGVAGTHGKTTTSSMLAHVLKSGGLNVTAFLGGITQNYNSNLILGDASQKQIVVVEADEFDRSFLRLSPNMTVITNSDPDHLDIYGDEETFHEGFKAYADKIPADGFLVISEKVNEGIYSESKAKKSLYSYDGAGCHAENLRFENGYLHFDYVGNVRVEACAMLIPGIHNVENAIAAITIALELGLTPDQIREGVSTFRGVKRRFEYHYRENGVVYIDDYAHHPSEISSFLNSLRVLYPAKKVTVVFQPHLFSRTQDFMDEFAKSLSIADRVLLLDIYPARELPIPGVTSQVLLNKITSLEKELITKENLIEKLESVELELVCTLGAGDVDRCIEPIKKMLTSRKGDVK